MTGSQPAPEREMTVEDARAVLWLRNKHRPLGELLDEGYLTETRLEWARQKAYDPKLKQAAAVLLEWLREQKALDGAPAAKPLPAEVPASLDFGITVEQARGTIWPYRELRGQTVGTLVDARQLTLKDLAYAVENAFDDHLKRAAALLLGLRLGQAVEEPPPPAGPLQVVSAGRSHAERRERQLLFLEGTFLGAGFCLSLVLLVQSLRKVLASPPRMPPAEMLASPVGVVALVVVILLMLGLTALAIYLISLIPKRFEKRIENYRKGQEGEEQVVEAMRQALDGTWVLFRNVVLPGRNKADIDGVLVGPSGVWALEVKTLSGEYRNTGDQWEYRAGNHWSRMRSSPSQQAQKNAARLGSFLRADGIKQWIEPAVIWANPESPLTVVNQTVAVWRLDRLAEELGNVWQWQELPESTRTRVVEKLTTLVQPQYDA
jgi:hypothetical protein